MILLKCKDLDTVFFGSVAQAAQARAQSLVRWPHAGVIRESSVAAFSALRMISDILKSSTSYPLWPIRWQPTSIAESSHVYSRQFPLSSTVTFRISWSH